MIVAEQWHHDVDVKALLRKSVRCSIPTACNRSTVVAFPASSSTTHIPLLDDHEHPALPNPGIQVRMHFYQCMQLANILILFGRQFNHVWGGYVREQNRFQSSNAWAASAASAFGLKVAWLNRFGQTAERLPGRADVELKNLMELPDLLK
jgi:hypothetical protein